MIKLAVFGDPIGHSLSPTIHAQFAEQAGLAIEYIRIQASAAAFEERFAEFASGGGVGANITLPLKELAFQWADQCTAAAIQAGAVNTLTKYENKWFGENTDGIGLVADLQHHRISLEGAQVLLIGAGGAARGVMPALLAAKVASVHVANRTPERAEALIARIKSHVTSKPMAPISAGSLSSIPNAPFTVIINSTSSGLQGQSLALPNHILNTKPFSYDMVYGAKPTPFMQWALSNDCPVADGLGMLVNQAAASFQLWTKITPDVRPVLLLLRNRLGLWNSL